MNNFFYLELRGPKGKQVPFLRLPYAKSSLRLRSLPPLPDKVHEALKRNNNVLLTIGKTIGKDTSKRVFREALPYIRQRVEGARFLGEPDPETGLERRRTRSKRDLPADRCPFCKGKTDSKRGCDECGFSCFATCGKCKELGAPTIHAPRRMTNVRRKNGEEVKVCYPHCIRKMYKCVSCYHWIDKSLLHAFIRQDNNISSAICVTCWQRSNVTACASCHAVIEEDDSCKDLQGYKCRRCYSRGNSFRERKKDSTVIITTPHTTPDGIRTFGTELEINNVCHAEWLSSEVADLNIDGVEFEVVEDGSVHNGLEIVSFPAEKKAILPAMREVCKLVKLFQHDYSGSGLHVHIRDKRVDNAKLFKTWCAFEPLTFSFLPSSRRKGFGTMITRYLQQPLEDYLKGIETEEDAIEAQGQVSYANTYGGTRYSALNLLALAKHGTVEVRCHDATSEYADIYFFIQYLDALWNYAKRENSLEALLCLHSDAKRADGGDESSFSSLFHELGLPRSTKEKLWTDNRFFHANSCRPVLSTYVVGRDLSTSPFKGRGAILVRKGRVGSVRRAIAQANAEKKRMQKQYMEKMQKIVTPGSTETIPVPANLTANIPERIRSDMERTRRMRVAEEEQRIGGHSVIPASYRFFLSESINSISGAYSPRAEQANDGPF